MFNRSQKLHNTNSLFLFGARGTGKTTLLRQRLSSQEGVLWIDLLKDSDEERFARNPDELSHVLAQGQYQKVVIDEVQKAPRILDVVHLEIEKNKALQFLLTGSSARKLKRGAANLLAGRAFTYHLYPLTTAELGDAFELEQVLQFGTLPKIYEYSSNEDRNEYLRSYVKNYIREEVLIEQLIRKLDPFRSFLEVAAQCNGEPINYSSIARDVGVDDKTVHNYYSILEDTLLGFHLPSFHRSIRKQQLESPKFFLFDPGVARALAAVLRVPLTPNTYAFGNAFEHWVILECFRKNQYLKLDYRLSFLRSKSGAEVDLVIERPGNPDLLVEIKSSRIAKSTQTTHLNRYLKDWDKECEAQLWSLDPTEKSIEGVTCLPWHLGLEQL